MATGQRVEHAAGWDVSPTLSRVFFHPDYTVGPGVSPDHVVHSEPLAGYTADRELETALLTLPRRISLLLYYTRDRANVYPSKGGISSFLFHYWANC
ncbi:hypothetical protein BH23CHL1_BH23CHL1_08630 [soil metagenome]